MHHTPRRWLSALFFCLLLLSGCRPSFCPQEPATVLEPVPSRSSVLVGAPAICQYPGYPTGCESVATVMALQFVGEMVSVDDFINDHLACNGNFYRSWGRLYGPDPYQVFAGNPRSARSYGCMAPVIEKALLSYFGNSDRVINTTGTSLSSLCRDYLDNGLPVIMWATSNMTPVKKGNRWWLPNGQHFTWPSGEHCLLLVGYNDTHYFFNDPQTGTMVSYPHKTVEQRYTDMANQSLVITF